MDRNLFVLLWYNSQRAVDAFYIANYNKHTKMLTSNKNDLN